LIKRSNDQWAKSPNNQSEGVCFRHWKYSAMLSKTHSYRLIFRRFFTIDGIIDASILKIPGVRMMSY